MGMIKKPYPRAYNSHCKGKDICQWPVNVCLALNRCPPKCLRICDLLALVIELLQSICRLPLALPNPSPT